MHFWYKHGQETGTVSEVNLPELRKHNKQEYMWWKMEEEVKGKVNHDLQADLRKGAWSWLLFSKIDSWLKALP